MRLLLGCQLLIWLTACGGGSGKNSPPPAAPPPPVVTEAQSPGGVWFAQDSSGESVSMFITEAGELRTIMQIPGALLPSIGSGTVSVDSIDTVSGSFELEGAFDPFGGLNAEDLGCSVSGTVAERQSLAIEIVCSDSVGIVIEESLLMIHDPGTYSRTSSLEALAGIYTLEFMPATNSLNIATDGTIFGMYHNGARCTVNGTAAIVDPQYSLIDVRWTMSACTDLIGIFEGVEMSGIAMASPSAANMPGSYYFLLTGRTPDGLWSISVIYDPV